MSSSDESDDVGENGMTSQRTERQVRDVECGVRNTSSVSVRVVTLSKLTDKTAEGICWEGTRALSNSAAALTVGACEALLLRRFLAECGCTFQM